MKPANQKVSLVCVLAALLYPLSALPPANGAPAKIPPSPRPLFKPQEHRGFYVAGLARRTNNIKELAGTGEIPKVWQEFSEKHIEEMIPGRLDDDLLAVYTDYESDQNGDYTYLLGKRVPDVHNLPAGLIGRYVPSGRYAEIVSDQGPIAEVVSKMWQRIWSMSPLTMGGRRAFEADYEVYNERNLDPKNARVSAFVGVQ